MAQLAPGPCTCLEQVAPIKQYENRFKYKNVLVIVQYLKK